MMFDLNRLADSENKYAVFALNIVSSVALVVAAAWFSYNMFSTKDAELPVRIVNRITLDPTVLLAGRPFVTHVNVTLNKLCPYEVRWSLVRKGDGVEVVRIVEPMQQPAAVTGTQDLPAFPRYVPATVQPGEYRYIAEVFDMCPGVHTVTPVRSSIDLAIR
jgi:hypothetical protein